LKISAVILFFCCPSFLYGQQPFHNGDQVPDFAINKILNSAHDARSFNNLRGEITIIDFFGTWCLPCIKALPRLQELQTTFGEKLNIVLVSTEKEERLNKFIAARRPFGFEVIADETGSISNLFAPPSYPYTLVLNKDNRILAITDAGSISEKNIQDWLSSGEEKQVIISNPAAEKTNPTNPLMNMKARSNNQLVSLSQEFIYAAKSGDSTAHLEEQLSSLSMPELEKLLSTDAEKKAFWVNLYNGFTQSLLKKDPAAYQHRGRFFRKKQINIAGNKFSLDAIEHGILRHSKIKWSLGYFNKLFPDKTEKALRVAALDYRIHFALNCGAKACPPIAFYDPADIDRQLDMAATAYLSSEAIFDQQKNKLGLPAIMGWFRRDFGGKKKMLLLVKEKLLIPVTAFPAIHFNKYDWELHLNNYQN
jgi:thiol-disulfide isomerase/thioredoxin